MSLKVQHCLKEKSELYNSLVYEVKGGAHAECRPE